MQKDVKEEVVSSFVTAHAKEESFNDFDFNFEDLSEQSKLNSKIATKLIG